MYGVRLGLLLPVLLMLPALPSMAAPIKSAAGSELRLDQELHQIIKPIHRVVNGKNFYLLQIEPPRGHTLERFFEENKHFVRYLAEHGPQPGFAQLVPNTKNIRELSARYYDVLGRSDAYHELLRPALNYHLKRPAAPATRAQPSPDRAISLDDVTSVAVRFFYPHTILPDNSIQSHVCDGINGIADLGRRDLAIETLAFSAIQRQFDLPDSPLRRDYEQAKRLMNKLPLSTDPEVRVKRAQGVMWGHMAGSASLRMALLTESLRMTHLLRLRIWEAS